jgi:CBS domain containing-hemolysin-like protein
MSFELLCAVCIGFIWLLCAWEGFSGLSRGRIRRIETENKELAGKLENWLERQNEFNVVFGLLAFFLTAFIGMGALQVSYDIKPGMPVAWRLGTVSGIILLFLIFAGELARIINSRLDIKILNITMPLIAALRITCFSPVVILMLFVEKRLPGWRNKEWAEDKPSAEDEIMSLVEQDFEEAGSESLEDDEKRMIKGIFELDYTPVREIMTPRVDMIALPSTATIKEAKQTFVSSGHSRIPVYQRNIDEIKGILYAKDFLDDSRQCEKLEELTHKPLFLPETKNVGDLLKEFKNNSIHVAIIIDEYGGTSGVVTLEDILEEIVGEIRDEYDSEEDVEPEMVKMEDGSVIVDARSLISDVNEILEIEIPEDEDVDTVGGYVCGEFGRIPEAGEALNIEGVAHFTVLKADKRKILSLKIKAFSQELD